MCVFVELALVVAGSQPTGIMLLLQFRCCRMLTAPVTPYKVFCHLFAALGVLSGHCRRFAQRHSHSVCGRPFFTAWVCLIIDPLLSAPAE